jgi:NTP pyrophosphatase (non-canonical NTP hydrolase)
MPGSEHPLCIGSDTWPGISKLIEECGEVQQLSGKIAAFPFEEVHPDGQVLSAAIEEELGDLLGAIRYVTLQNSLSIEARAQMKFERFMRWDREERSRRAGPGREEEES